MYLALRKETNDLFLNPEGGIHRVKDGRFIVQQVSCKLKTLLGEWILDDSIGYLSLGDLKKNYDDFDLELRLYEIVAGTQGVLSVDEVTFDTVDRKLDINFIATTIYGTIDTKIPWDNEPRAQLEILPNIGNYLKHNGLVVTFNGEPIRV